MEIIRYNASYEAQWNDFVAHSKNGTFLFDRRYMDYHADRFHDASLICFHQNKICALLPGNEFDGCFYSHQGLTYGGFILPATLSVVLFKELFEAVLLYLRKEGYYTWIYKPIPSFYCSYPSSEDRYLLFLHGAKQLTSAIAGTVELQQRLPYTRERRRAVQRGLEKGIQVEEITNLHPFWKVMEANMWNRFQARPVHTVEQMELLRSRFPDNIRLFGALLHGDLLAGALIYDTGRVIRVQYGHASPEGKAIGALDCVYDALLRKYEPIRKYLDFGQCTEQGGQVLNEGLIHQKEGFGARATIYDSYQIDLI